jgi:alpha-tubulin suppressor-like RCC1 family protein
VALDAGTVGTLSLGPLPLGSVAITGQAFNVACASIASQAPTWISDKDVVTLQAGVVTSLTLTFRPNNPVTGTPSFVGNVVQIAIGDTAIYAVMTDGTVEASGTVPDVLYSAPTFGVVSALSNIAAIGPSNYDYWACALVKNATVECWGVNVSGNLGNGTTTTAPLPVAVTGLANITQLSVGAEHACAVNSSAQLYCWGDNANGEVGTGTMPSNVLTPALVVGTVSNVSCGGAHTCAVVNGKVWCWGANGNGQLGNNATADSFSPVLVVGVEDITQVSAGAAHTCALRGDGAVFCWGSNAYGQLGIGSLADSHTPAQAAISGVTQIATSFYDTCARRNDGSVWCWGYDYYGSVGAGQGQNAQSPAEVIGLPPSASIAATSYDACSVGTDLSVYCWGINGNGQLGNGGRLEAPTPIPVQL